MKPAWMLLAVLLAAFAVGLTVTSCTTPPPGLVLYDSDNDGNYDCYARDVNEDGIISSADYQVDTDNNGVADTPEMMSEKLVTITENVDAYTPGALTLVGSLAGIPLAGVIAGVWQKIRFGRIFANTVASVQLYRKKIAAGGLDVLEEVDKAVADEQGRKVVKAIAKAKADADIAPVT